jgi:YD repeat-containing protein
MDGSVVAYRRQNLTQSGEVIWVPKAVDNPSLLNPSDGSPGANNNLFNNRITQKMIDGVILYTLTGADGSIRTFKTRSFPVVGSETLTRTRPYLESWQDNQGNCYTFSFGSDKLSPDWGELIAISSSNGNGLHFHYDTKGHIIEAFTSDARILKYEYSAQGDLIKVTLPDASVITYDYKEENNPSGKGTYSTHLITEERKPEGRIIQNSYDAQRRVISQAATVGTKPTPTTSAAFKYEVTTNKDKTLTGTTKVTDSSGNITTYVYSNSQITSISYPKNGSGVAPTTTQEWYQGSGYPRSLKRRVDRRGLITDYQYDLAGNLISRTLTGNLTGSDGSEKATMSFAYNGNNILISTTDSLGEITSYSYGDGTHPYSPTLITKSVGEKTISSTQLQYTNTGGAYGLLSTLIKDGSTTTYSYDAHGFLAAQIIQTGTDDPQIKHLPPVGLLQAAAV